MKLTEEHKRDIQRQRAHLVAQGKRTWKSFTTFVATAAYRANWDRTFNPSVKETT